MSLYLSSRTLSFSKKSIKSISTRAHQMFDKSTTRDLSESEYRTLLFENSRNGLNREALGSFLGLSRSGFVVDALTISLTLKVCGCLADQCVGKQVHCRCVKSGLSDDVSVGASLVDTYMKTEGVTDARRVFDEMRVKNAVAWTALLSGYAQSGLNELTVDLFSQMHRNGVKPNPLTFVTVFGAIAHRGSAEEGSQIHNMALKSGYESSAFVCNSIINMYSKSGAIKRASLVFDGLENKDMVTWNSLISGCVTNGVDSEAFKLFRLMRLAGEKLTQPGFVSLVKSCSNLKELGFTRQLHCHTVKNGSGFDRNLETAFMVAYIKCGETEDACKVFSAMRTGGQSQTVVSWTAMIAGFVQNGAKERAVRLFSQMCRDGVRPNHFTYSSILTAQPPEFVLQIHAQAVKTNHERSTSVGTALLDAYVKLGNVEEASKVFELVDEKDVVAWSAMLVGYAQTGETAKAVGLFRDLAREGVRANEYTFSSAIHACAGPAAGAGQGRQLHAASIKARLDGALCVSSALLTMYAKRGSIESAERVFERQRERDLISWNSMVSGFAQHGQAEKALGTFRDMQRREEGIEMDDVTFIAVITACAHAGLVEEGRKHFDAMIESHGIAPRMEHYSCMVDLYSRAGKLREAAEVIDGMPFPADATIWRTLLAACHVRRDSELGALAAEKLISIEPRDSAAYVLLSNIYAATGKWEERAAVRRSMEKRRVNKEAGYSWIEVKNKTYSFLAGDASHPMSSSIDARLEELGGRMKEMGYEPDTNYVLHDVDEEHKAAILFRHSERLAIAFGLISMPPGAPIHVIKNLRVCGDCHTVVKLISSIERRDIVVRDSNRFHHFKDGVCSCGDFW